MWRNVYSLSWTKWKQKKWCFSFSAQKLNNEKWAVTALHKIVQIWHQNKNVCQTKALWIFFFSVLYLYSSSVNIICTAVLFCFSIWPKDIFLRIWNNKAAMILFYFMTRQKTVIYTKEFDQKTKDITTTRCLENIFVPFFVHFSIQRNSMKLFEWKHQQRICFEK